MLCLGPFVYKITKHISLVYLHVIMVSVGKLAWCNTVEMLHVSFWIMQISGIKSSHWFAKKKKKIMLHVYKVAGCLTILAFLCEILLHNDIFNWQRTRHKFVLYSRFSSVYDSWWDDGLWLQVLISQLNKSPDQLQSNTESGLQPSALRWRLTRLSHHTGKGKRVKKASRETA